MPDEDNHCSVQCTGGAQAILAFSRSSLPTAAQPGKVCPAQTTRCTGVITGSSSMTLSGRSHRGQRCRPGSRRAALLKHPNSLRNPLFRTPSFKPTCSFGKIPNCRRRGYLAHSAEPADHPVKTRRQNGDGRRTGGVRRPSPTSPCFPRGWRCGCPFSPRRIHRRARPGEG
jgi:hypothetical protein